MNEMSTLIKETPQSSLAPRGMWGQMAVCEPGGGPPSDMEFARALMLDFQPPEL